MVFYRIHCKLTAAPEETETKEVLEMTSDFQTDPVGIGYYFLSALGKNTATVGVVCGKNETPTHVEEFLEALGRAGTVEKVEEVTFGRILSMLNEASKRKYIGDNKEAVFNYFGLGGFARSSHCVPYEERIIGKYSREKALKVLDCCLASDSFLPELDRIAQGKAADCFSGHPVQYIIEYDVEEDAEKLCDVLTGALHDAGRMFGNRVMTFPACALMVSSNWYEDAYKCCCGGTAILKVGKDDAERYENGEGMGDIEDACHRMIKYNDSVQTVFCIPSSQAVIDVIRQNKGNVTFVHLKSGSANGKTARTLFTEWAKEKNVCADLLPESIVEDSRTYALQELHSIFDNWYSSIGREKAYPQYAELFGKERADTSENEAEKKSAYDELKEMIGLEQAKKAIDSVIAYNKMRKIYKNRGMKIENASLHMVFTGNPGTAKTTVARLFSRILAENGILSKGHLVEVGRGDLIGKYVGWTAKLVKEKFAEAEGGVLFIDEAYALVDDRSHSFGDEAINTIVQEMENRRENLVVIFAGYSEQMREFLDTNPGMNSRIAFHVHFDDYDTEELVKIAELIGEKKGLRFGDGATEKLANEFARARKHKDFGNGRYVRNMIERADMNKSRRLLSGKTEELTDEELFTVCKEDIECPCVSEETERRRIGFAC